MVSFLIFKSLNHFEFIFVFGMRKYSNLNYLHAAFPTPLTEEIVFSSLDRLASFVKGY